MGIIAKGNNTADILKMKKDGLIEGLNGVNR